MEILSERKFKTANHVTINVYRVGGMVHLDFENVPPIHSTASGDFNVCLYEDEVEAFNTLTEGGTLEVPSKFSPGDLVRYVSGHRRPQGALAEVVDVGGGYLKVRWIDARANILAGGRRRDDGYYFVVSFELVNRDDLTDEDYRSIAEHALDSRA